MDAPYPYPNKTDSPRSHDNYTSQLNIGPRLKDVLAALGETPPYALLVGLCDDDFPLLLDLSHPSPGHCLLAADDYIHNASALYGLLLTATLFNTTQTLALHILTTDLNRYPALIQVEHLKASFSPEEPEAGVFIEELYNLALTRQQQQRPLTPIHILAIDEFDLLIETLNMDQRMQLRWLLEHGQHFGIRIFASIESNYLHRSLLPWIDKFPARLVGAVENQQLAHLLAGVDAAELVDLEPGQVAFFRSPNQARYLWLPQLD